MFEAEAIKTGRSLPTFISLKFMRAKRKRYGWCWDQSWCYLCQLCISLFSAMTCTQFA